MSSRPWQACSTFELVIAFATHLSNTVRMRERRPPTNTILPVGFAAVARISTDASVNSRRWGADTRRCARRTQVDPTTSRRRVRQLAARVTMTNTSPPPPPPTKPPPGREEEFADPNGEALEEQQDKGVATLDRDSERSFDTVLQELTAIQQDGPRNVAILGTRYTSYLHQQIIELLTYANVLVGNHVFTSGAGGTNAAVIRGALRAEKPELLTVVLPQSLHKQPKETQEQVWFFCWCFFWGGGGGT